MSTEVSVDTKLDGTDVGIFAGLIIVMMVGLSAAGYNTNNVKNMLGILTLAVLGLLLWGMLTGHEKVAKFILNHQMIALGASVLVAATSAYSFFTIGAVRSVHV